jgi:hypothetical protein
MMWFSVYGDGEEKKEVNLALSNDIHFVTAFPCVSSNHTDLLNSATSPSFQVPQQAQTGSSRTFTGMPKSNSKFISSRLIESVDHPLHKAFTYTKIPLSTLLAMPSSLPFSSLLSPLQFPIGDPTQSTTHTTNSPIPKVLVIDCTDTSETAFSTGPTASPHSSTGSKGREFGSDMEMLARALCAERGWNALISRRGRGCLSCSIREASALGWRVVLRFA